MLILTLSFSHLRFFFSFVSITDGNENYWHSFVSLSTLWHTKNLLVLNEDFRWGGCFNSHIFETPFSELLLTDVLYLLKLGQLS